MTTRQKVNNSMYVTKGSPPFNQRAKSALLMGELTAYRYGNASQYFMRTVKNCQSKREKYLQKSHLLNI